uniref:Uncharacterized protein C19orf71 n=1 Tax=Anthurium amnicola TaxID=1678845 RepID=A0A1D1Z7C8_9ARAE
MWTGGAALSPPGPASLSLPGCGKRCRGGGRGVASAANPPLLRISSSRARDHYRSKKTSKPSPPNRKLEFSFDVEEIAGRASADLRRFRRSAETRLRRFVSSGREAYHDLRTSVRVEGGRRVVFSCNRSSLLFVADLALWSAVAVVSFRALAWLVVGLRWRWGLGDWWVIRRDRSLGGREVVVGRRSSGEEVEWRSSRALRNPLSPPRGSEIRRADASPVRGVPREEKLPEWWPNPVPPPPVGVLGREELQREANKLVRAIMDNRMSGKDYKEEDIIQLRRICRLSSVKVLFDTVNARDSFYRASVEFILNTCSRVTGPDSNVRIDGEEVRHFIAGLAGNIGLENIHAVRVLRGAVAASTRSRFLQAWALEVQGERSRALEELVKICHIFQIFPPEKNSPEMEMVAGGLEKILKVEQRAHLLNLFGQMCGPEGQKIAAATLGLVKFTQSESNDITSGSRT